MYSLHINATANSLQSVLVVQRFGPFNQAVVGSIPGRGVIKAPRTTQPSIPPYVGLQIKIV